ncbi:MAG TPA: hypothetical protein VFW83_08395, partial [Bryobacteraceae bacterium]|nr:hypothetical protein [Bryobacteraceae bacterium]
MIRCLTGWALFFVLWLLFADSTQGYELLVGAGVAALAVAGTEAARIKQHVTGELHIRWLIPLVRIPIAVLRDCGVVLAAWIHEFPHGPRQGRFVWIPFT